MTNGRGAMVGLVAMFIVEKAIGGPITGIFSGSSDELFASTFYDDSFAAQVEAPAPAAKFADFDSTVVAPAPVAAEATLAYEDAVAAEPIPRSRAPPTRRWRRGRRLRTRRVRAGGAAADVAT